MEVRGGRGYRLSAVVRPVGCTHKFSKTTLTSNREINIKLSGNSCGGHSCSQYANCTLTQLDKGEMFTYRDVNNLCPKFDLNKLFVRMEKIWDLLFQLVKHGTNTLHVAFIFMFSIINAVQCCTLCRN